MTIIVSPSGKLYGSESVLVDYLKNTSIKDILIFVPANSTLYNELKHRFPRMNLKSFSDVIILYGRIFLLLLFRKSKVVYLNEGGHIRYLKILAFFFRYVTFYNHIRILEDTSIDRIGNHNFPNIRHIVISKYLGDQLLVDNYVKIYDPYLFKKTENRYTIKRYPIKIGIVGRVTPTKGMSVVERIMQYLDGNTNNEFEIHFYGDIEKEKIEIAKFVDRTGMLVNLKCTFHGFVGEKEKIYGNIDLLFHANQQEALGRVILEALDHDIPVIGVTKGGVYELFDLLGLKEYCIDTEDELCYENFLKQVNQLINTNNRNLYKEARRKAQNIFDDRKYAKQIDGILAG